MMLIDHVIVEAQNYQEMFNDIFKLNPNPQLRRQIADNIDWARRTLRKNDRIVWFLRWVKLWASSAGAAAGITSTALTSAPQDGAPVPGAMQQYNRRFGTAYGQGDVVSPPALKQQLEHFLSLPVPEIQNYVFKTETPTQLFDLFAGYEAGWRQRIEEERSLITPQSGDEILIKFPDGFAWWLLPRGGCSVEAQAMGHCGNVPSQRPGDRILSLRRQVQRGDIVRWYPVATFILDRDGQLGEMKGRGNDKPAPKYHPYILELLRHHIIKGIKGGGYMPENNFAMSDLDPQTREQLIAGKPELKGLLGYYEEEGMTDRVRAMLDNTMASRGLPSYDAYDRGRREFILNRYRDLEQFVIANGDEVLEQLLELRERAEDAHSHMPSAKADLDKNTLRRFLETLPHRLFSEIAVAAGVDPTMANAHRLVAHRLDDQGGPIFNRFERAFIDASRHGALIRALDERIAEYANDGWNFEGTYVWAAFVNPNDVISSAIETRIAEHDLVYMATADEEDDEHGYDAYKIAQSGSWDDIDWESTFEHRRANGLIRRKAGGGGWDYVDAAFADPRDIKLDTHDLIDAAVELYVSPRKSSATIGDPRQFELTLEALRRRAGIRPVATSTRLHRPARRDPRAQIKRPVRLGGAGPLSVGSSAACSPDPTMQRADHVVRVGAALRGPVGTSRTSALHEGRPS